MSTNTGELNRYAPPSAPLRDRPELPDSAKATRSSRLGANMLDGFAALLFIYVPLLSLGMPAAPPPARQPLGQNAFVISYLWSANGRYLGLVGLAVLLAINVYLLHRNGQSIGKRLVGIKILRSNGDRAALARIVFIRDLPFLVAGFLPFLNLLSIIDPLFIFGARLQCLHDRAADTIVVKVESTGAPNS